jgi:hypothetical protein
VTLPKLDRGAMEREMVMGMEGVNDGGSEGEGLELVFQGMGGLEAGMGKGRGTEGGGGGANG